MTARCTCRRLDHQPTACQYQAGCTGCLCDLPAHHRPHLTWCGPCGEYHLSARLVHAQRRAVPSGAVPPPSGVTVATPCPPPVRVGGGPACRPASVSPMADRSAPTTVAGTSVVGALFGPAGTRSPSPRNPRPGPHGGDAA